jgi:hypothetical protein
MSSAQQTHPTAFTKKELGWLRNMGIGRYTIGSGFRSFTLRPISSIERPRFLPFGAVHGIRVGRIDRDVPYFMVEARQKTDYFESGGSTGQGALKVRESSLTVSGRQILLGKSVHAAGNLSTWRL